MHSSGCKASEKTQVTFGSFPTTSVLRQEWTYIIDTNFAKALSEDCSLVLGNKARPSSDGLSSW